MVERYKFNLGEILTLIKPRSLEEFGSIWFNMHIDGKIRKIIMEQCLSKGLMGAMRTHFTKVTQEWSLADEI